MGHVSTYPDKERDEIVLHKINHDAERRATLTQLEKQHSMIKPPQCPICERPLVGEIAREGISFPFCSERCRRVDFFRWCDGKYAIVEPLDPHRMAEELEQRRAELIGAEEADETDGTL